MKAIVFLAACLGVTLANDTVCPNIPVVQDFDVPHFMGRWYQQSNYHSFLFQGKGSCTRTELQQDEDSGIITMDYSQTTSYGGLQSTQGFAVVVDSSSSEGKFNLTISSIFGDVTMIVNILDTDYKNYAILYSCKEVLAVPYESAWLLTRHHTLDKETNDDIEAAFAKIEKSGGPKKSSFVPVPQNNCW